MTQPIDEATAAFLEAAADDLQRQVGISAVVDGLTVYEDQGGVCLVLTLRIGQRLIEVRGTGETILTAYADLRLRVPEPILVTAFGEVMT